MLLNKYISYRESLSLGDTDELIITFDKPYHPASKDTTANFIVGTLTVMITQEMLNFLMAFCLQLIVHNTFDSLHSKLA